MADEIPLNQGGAVQPQTEEDAMRAAMHVHKEEEDLGSAKGATADENPAGTKQVWDHALHRIRSFQGDTEQYVRENPTKAVFTALGFGVVLGLIFRR